MAKAEQSPRRGFRQTITEFGQTVSFTAKNDRLFLPLGLAIVIVPVLVTALLAGFGIGWSVLSGSSLVIIGVLLASIGFLTLLALRTNAAMINALRGKPGASWSMAKTLGNKWLVWDEPFDVTTLEDMVFLLLGPPGVVLLAEGNTGRLRPMLAQRKRQLSRVIGSADLRDYIVGEDEGKLPLAKLRSTLTGLPRTLSGKEVSALDTRLRALKAASPTMPRGPIPKNMRRAAMRMMRGGR